MICLICTQQLQPPLSFLTIDDCVQIDIQMLKLAERTGTLGILLAFLSGPLGYVHTYMYNHSESVIIDGEGMALIQN